MALLWLVAGVSLIPLSCSNLFNLPRFLSLCLSLENPISDAQIEQFPSTFNTVHILLSERVVDVLVCHLTIWIFHRYPGSSVALTLLIFLTI